MKRNPTTTAGLLLAAAATLAACADAPSSPSVRAAAMVEAAVIANGQTAYRGETVAAAPAVVVRDDRGQALGGVTVRFTVTQGGGSVDSASATTNRSGIASAGRWTLGPAAGANEVEARVTGLPPVRFSATSLDPPAPPPTAPPATGSFRITVRYLTTPSLRQRAAVDAAIARWERAIVGDLPDIPINVAKGTCAASQPALNEIVDDMLLLVDFDSIDGPGKVLGQAGPCFVRSGGGQPVIGVMALDSADLAHMASIGTLDDVVLHELGHVLGIGTLWKTVGLLSGAGTPDPEFTGSRALAAYREMGGLTAGVPVENTGGTGTREGHWRESVFVDELMTGWIGIGANPLSGMTIASLEDMGYGASLAAAGMYVFGGAPSSLRGGTELRGREHLHGPRFRVDKRGRPERID